MPRGWGWGRGQVCVWGGGWEGGKCVYNVAPKVEEEWESKSCGEGCGPVCPGGSGTVRECERPGLQRKPNVSKVGEEGGGGRGAARWIRRRGPMGAPKVHLQIRAWSLSFAFYHMCCGACMPLLGRLYGSRHARYGCSLRRQRQAGQRGAGARWCRVWCRWAGRQSVVAGSAVRGSVCKAQARVVRVKVRVGQTVRV